MTELIYSATLNTTAEATKKLKKANEEKIRVT